jgi:regulator of protease activity HflC (stomatin/prohibitin superfamily)
MDPLIAGGGGEIKSAPAVQAYRADKFIEPERKPPVNEYEGGGLCCPSMLSCVLSTVGFCTWCCACTTVDERTERVILVFGKFQGVIREPGCYCMNPCGLTSRIISTARSTIDLTHCKVADARGNPVLLSGVVTYQIVDARKAALEVTDVRGYISTNSLAVVKRTASAYPYEGKEGEHSLKTEAAKLRAQMVSELQERVNAAGVLVINFELTDLAYAPEIAQSMLIRQQAEAMVDARKIIVEGAVQISTGALAGLADRGVKLSKEDEARMVSNLLVVICGDSKVTPTVQVGST